MEMKCVHLGKPTGIKKHGQPSFNCEKLQCHVVEGEASRTVPGCSVCKEKILPTDNKAFLTTWKDPLEVIDRTRSKTTALRDMLGGASVFLACSGPSANDLPLEQLNRRGIWTMCVNNMAGHGRFRPQAFVCSDPLFKFSHSIWLDPTIMKWVPSPKMAGGRAKLKEKRNGEFVWSEKSVTDCPNVWGFRRNPWLTPDDDFFLSNGAGWGNQNAGVKRTGEKKTVNTMLLAMRILRYLGAKRVFMIGADFRMSGDYGYSFNQGIEHKRSKNPKIQTGWDNNQYEIVDEWLTKMQKNGVFKKFGIEFYNCFQHSSLRAFPYVPFEQAMKECKGIVEDQPDLGGWYEKTKVAVPKEKRRR